MQPVRGNSAVTALHNKLLDRIALPAIVCSSCANGIYRKMGHKPYAECDCLRHSCVQLYKILDSRCSHIALSDMFDLHIMFVETTHLTGAIRMP